ncbi:DUF6906 family protein [Anaeromicropila populeti]|uniref:DUF6906 family protein n=1 Tax=Anaeromicropila populeti TaxID=37658 RepID=UPI0015A707AE|nr:hypothetical protein [Anaeromicropila populeti]
MGKQRAIRPTRRQKEIIENNHLISANWLVVSEQDDCMLLESKKNGRTRKINKVS